MLFKDKSVDPIEEPMETVETDPVPEDRIFYIRLELDRHNKGLHRNSFLDHK